MKSIKIKTALKKQIKAIQDPPEIVGDQQAPGVKKIPSPPPPPKGHKGHLKDIIKGLKFKDQPDK